MEDLIYYDALKILHKFYLYDVTNLHYDVTNLYYDVTTGILTLVSTSLYDIVEMTKQSRNPELQEGTKFLYKFGSALNIGWISSVGVTS